MLDFQQNRKVRSFMYHPATLGILFVLVLIVVRATWKVYDKKIESEELKNVSYEHVSDLQSRSDELQAKIDRLNTDIGREEEIRSKFSVVKGGEAMVLVVPAPNSEESTTTLSLSFWQKLTSLFK